MQDPAKALALVLICLFTLAACGQKGPLFLPGDPSEVRTVMQQEAPAGETEEDEDENDIP